MGPLPNRPPQPDDSPDTYIGLNDSDAERRARSRGWTTIRSLPPGSVITLEYVAGRINFEVDHHTVRRCWIG
ncbi:I78 family peptidase inhibitor [Streptomyces sp. NPDC047928]|uniref:I78 family peptidase inhibitor n=1 Tax=unclassified Streptomyces TaxID=2593676 RepID=UPI003718C696